MSEKKDIRSLSFDELSNYFLKNGEKKFRAKQVFEWIWNKSVTDFDSMSNISKSQKDLLKLNYVFRPISLYKHQNSKDGTIKSAFQLHDGHFIEGVLIPSEGRYTACISSQVGCSLSCKFCATGYMDRKRNLDPGEIYDQVVKIREITLETYQKPLSNIVYMGMGEPLLNYKNVLESVDRITSVSGLGMSPRRITVSTAGIAKMIKRLGDNEVKFKLALSLHAADDIKRNQIMPINESNSLDSLNEALNYYYRKTRNQVTFEYILFNKFNDTIDDAKQLLKFCRKVPSKVNIIEYNPIEEAKFKNTDPKSLDKFEDFLVSNGINVRVRRSRGKDIDAACGQLANKQ